MAENRYQVRFWLWGPVSKPLYSKVFKNRAHAEHFMMSDSVAPYSPELIILEDCETELLQWQIQK